MSFYARFLASGALPQLKELYLFKNQIGDVGMQALAGAVSKGALDKLQKLYLDLNQIGDAGLSALATALTPGQSGNVALDKLTVRWFPTALSSCPETCHMHSPDSYLLFYVPYAGTCSLWKQYWGCRPHRFRKSGGERGAGQVTGELAPHCLVLMPRDFACAFS